MLIVMLVVFAVVNLVQLSSLSDFKHEVKHSLLSCRLPQNSFGISLCCLQHNKASLRVQKSGLVAFLVFLSSDLNFYELRTAKKTRIPLAWLAPSV